MAETTKRKGGSRPPISAHPAFPAIVALWFAALLGIGSMILPGVLMERLLGSVPEFSTRLVIAFGFAIAGAGAGLLIAKKVQNSGHERAAPRVRARRGSGSWPVDGLAKRPIVATEELGEEGLGPVVDEDESEAPDQHSNPPMPGRRRALAVTDDGGRSEYFASVPLPGQGSEASEIDEDAMPLDGFASDDAAASEDAGDDAAQDSTSEPDLHQDESAQVLDAQRNPIAAEQAGNGDAEQVPAPMFTPIGSSAEEGASGDDTPLIYQPMLSDTLDELDADPLDGGAFAASVEADAHDDVAQGQRFGAAPAVTANETAAPPVATDLDTPLADLPMSELIDRFAAALEKDRVEKADAGRAEQAVPVFERSEPEIEDEPDAAPLVFEPLTATPMPFEEAGRDQTPVRVEAHAATPLFGRPEGQDAAPDADADSAIPTALRPLDLGVFDEDEGEDEDDPFATGLTLASSSDAPSRQFATLNSGPFAAPAEGSPKFAPPAQPAMPSETTVSFGSHHESEQTADFSGDDGGYSSLLSMKSPLTSSQPFVRVEDDEEEQDAERPAEAAVAFPGSDNETPPAETSFDPNRRFDTPPNAERPVAGQPSAVSVTKATVQADPVETEKALRDALEKLQRMSGAA